MAESNVAKSLRLSGVGFRLWLMPFNCSILEKAFVNSGPPSEFTSTGLAPASLRIDSNADVTTSAVAPLKARAHTSLENMSITKRM